MILGQEIEGRHKSIPAIFFSKGVFERYINGEMTSYAGKTELKIRAVGEVDGEEDQDMGSSESDSESGSASAGETEMPVLSSCPRPPNSQPPQHAPLPQLTLVPRNHPVGQVRLEN